MVAGRAPVPAPIVYSGSTSFHRAGRYQAHGSEARSIAELASAAGLALDNSSERIMNDALQSIERLSRDQLQVVSYHLGVQLRLYEVNKIEHDNILKELSSRQLPVIEDPHV